MNFAGTSELRGLSAPSLGEAALTAATSWPVPLLAPALILGASAHGPGRRGKPSALSILVAALVQLAWIAARAAFRP